MERKEIIENFMLNAQSHICKNGNWLSGSQRKEIALEAIGCWNNCDICSKMKKSEILFECHSSNTAVSSIVHGVSNLQKVISREWYLSMIKLLKIEFPKISKIDIYSLYTEIVIIVSWAIGIASYYSAIGEKIPDFPEVLDLQKDCLKLKISSFVENFSPNDLFSSKIMNFRMNSKISLFFYEIAKRELNPYSQIMLSPYDVVEYVKWIENIYLLGFNLTDSQVELIAESCSSCKKCSNIHILHRNVSSCFKEKKEIPFFEELENFSDFANKSSYSSNKGFYSINKGSRSLTKNLYKDLRKIDEARDELIGKIGTNGILDACRTISISISISKIVDCTGNHSNSVNILSNITKTLVFTRKMLTWYMPILEFL